MNKEHKLRESIISAANSHIGEQEIKGNMGFKNPKFYELMRKVGFKKSHAWCCYFAELCWIEGYQKIEPGSITDITKLFSPSVMKTWRLFKQKGHDLGFLTSKTPNVGDLVFWQSGRNKAFGHIGIVVEVKGNVFYTIEGNTNDKGGREGYIVANKKRSLNFTKSRGLNLIGFISPEVLIEEVKQITYSEPAIPKLGNNSSFPPFYDFD